MDTRDETQIWEIRKKGGNGVSESGQPDHWKYRRGGCGLLAGEYRCSNRGDMGAGGRQLESSGNDCYRLRSPNKLSGGQKQRVAIAGVMAMQAECIILDEPTAMLDPNGRREVIRTVQQLNRQEGITVLLITHYMEEAVEAVRIIVMDDGPFKSHGAPGYFFRVRELKEHGLDVPQVTELAWN